MLGLSLGVSGVRRRPSYSAEAAALFARMTVQPTAIRKTSYNILITDLKTSGVWSKLDALYLLAAHDKQSALLNLKAAAFNLTEAVVGTFAADAGWTGDGVASYLSSGFNPSTAGGTWTQNSAHLSAMTGTAVLSATQFDIGSNAQSYFTSWNSGTVANGRLNSATATSHALTGAASFLVMSRVDAANHRVVSNGGAATTAASASVAMAAGNMCIGARGTTTTPTNFSTRQIKQASWGAGLTDAEMASLHAAVAGYITRL